ncbi:hypothetical protein, partial [Escherichia albertii]|uniref:hypothetical protein n=1 Tax=Escherichia albertii TaxID=208962 RepID=UPI001ED90684
PISHDGLFFMPKITTNAAMQGLEEISSLKVCDYLCAVCVPFVCYQRKSGECYRNFPKHSHVHFLTKNKTNFNHKSLHGVSTR